MVLIGPHDDGGWSQAHYEGLHDIEKNVPDSHIAYIEFVPEGAEAEQVFRSLARKGFNLIYRHIVWLHGSDGNRGRGVPRRDVYSPHRLQDQRQKLWQPVWRDGSDEVHRRHDGWVAHEDGWPDRKLGYMATFPIPEELRLGNAFALGMQKMCPDCTMDVRWINTWHDPVIEKEAAASLFDAGAHVVFTGADTPAAGRCGHREGQSGASTTTGSATARRALPHHPVLELGPGLCARRQEVRKPRRTSLALNTSMPTPAQWASMA